jgi:hypothetical protein
MIDTKTNLPRLTLAWLLVFGMPSLACFHYAWSDLSTWIAMVEESRRSGRFHAEPAEPNTIRDSIALIWIGLRWLTLGTLLIALIELGRFARKLLLRKSR